MTTSPPATVRPLLMWLPLMAIVVLLAASAITGHGGLLARASAASSTLQVTGSVDKLVYIDASGCSSAAALDIGDLVPNDPWKATTGDCAITFGTSNSSLGADLNLRENPLQAGHAMRCMQASCNAAAYDRAINDIIGVDATEPPAGTSAFGAVLRSTSGAAEPVWMTDRVNPVGASITACSTPDVGDGTCVFGFGASADAGDGPGTYRAQAEFLVLAR